MKGDNKMTFMVIDNNSAYSLDIESLDELFKLGHERYQGCSMIIDWEEMVITIYGEED